MKEVRIGKDIWISRFVNKFKQDGKKVERDSLWVERGSGEGGEFYGEAEEELEKLIIKWYDKYF